jgi:hypothetical protein
VKDNIATDNELERVQIEVSGQNTDVSEYLEAFIFTLK